MVLVILIRDGWQLFGTRHDFIRVRFVELRLVQS